MFEHIVTQNCFAVRIGDNFIRSEVAARVYRTALAHVSSAVLNRVKEAKRRHSPLLWVGIRVGTRCWSDQINGLANLIASLHEEYPRLGVVIDGFSVPADRCSGSGLAYPDQQEYAAVIAAEKRVAEAVIQNLQKRSQNVQSIFNIIGSSIYEANVWAHAIDVYVSPFGSIQHKVGWFVSKPGVIHSNHKLLDNSLKYIWSVTQNIVKPRYCSRSAVKTIRSPTTKANIYRQLKDIEESGAGLLAAVRRVQGDPEFDNYEVDWRQLRDDVGKVIKMPRIALQLNPEVLLTRVKRPVKRLLQGLMNCLDRSNV
jgi:hypothetical protein